MLHFVLKVVGWNLEPRHPKATVLLVGVLPMNTILFGVYMRAPEFWELPNCSQIYVKHIPNKDFKGL